MRTAILATAEAAGWPRVRIHTLTLEGESAWRKALGRWPSPGEAAILLDGLGAPWVSAEMLATPAACARLKRWFAAGNPADTPERRAETIEHITFVGDNLLRPLAKRALASMPAPVLAHVAQNAILLPVGRDCGGFCAVLPSPAPDASEARRLIVLGFYGGTEAESAFMNLTAHELAHHWLVRAPAFQVQRTAAEIAEAADNRQRYLWCAKEWGLLGELTAGPERDEILACALAVSWGFAQRPRGCARNMRDTILREAEAAVLPPTREGDL